MRHAPIAVMNGIDPLEPPGPHFPPDAGTRFVPGFVVGLTAEGRIIGDLGRLGVGGGTPEGAATAAATLAAGGVTHLISFGLAGGLDPTLRAGALVVPAEIVDEGRCHAADPDLLRWLGGVTAARLAAGRAVVADVAAKAALFRATGAAAVDLESGAVARVARAHGLPFAALRVICDPAARALPPAALAALDSQGAIAILRVLAAVLGSPAQIPALIRLAGDARAARAALRSAAAGLRARGVPKQGGRV